MQHYIERTFLKWIKRLDPIRSWENYLKHYELCVGNNVLDYLFSREKTQSARHILNNDLFETQSRSSLAQHQHQNYLSKKVFSWKLNLFNLRRLFFWWTPKRSGFSFHPLVLLDDNFSLFPSYLFFLFKPTLLSNICL